MWALSRKQKELLTRWFDGEIDQKEERERAEALLDDEPAAELWISVLKELRAAARGAFREVRERANLESSKDVSARAVEAPRLSDMELEQLAPLLEAFHDDAVTEPERRAVEQLRENRDDVERFLTGLDALRRSVRAAASEQTSATPDLDLWGGVEAGIDKIERDRLVMRYVDGEIDGEAERQHVEALLEDPSHPATRLVEQLEELGVAVRAAHREATDTDLSDIWAGVDEALNDEWRSAETSAGVVSIEDRRREDESQSKASRSDKEETGGTGGVIELFSGYGQAIAGAAAAIVLMFVGGLLYQNFVGSAPAGPKKQVVIVEDYEEKSSSVKVRSVQPTGTQNETEESKVIWLSDETRGNNASNGTSGQSRKHVPSGGPDVGVGTKGEKRPDSGRANRDWPDGGTPIEKEEHQAPAGPGSEQVDKPGDGPI